MLENTFSFGGSKQLHRMKCRKGIQDTPLVDQVKVHRVHSKQFLKYVTLRYSLWVNTWKLNKCQKDRK